MADVNDPYGIHSTRSSPNDVPSQPGPSSSRPSATSTSRRRANGRESSSHDATEAQEEDREDIDSRDKDRFYTLLNVEREASEEQIRQAYRDLAVALHPDKHTDEAGKAAAQSRFREIQHAYEILSDKEKRSVYDYFGEEGLTSTWAISTRGRSPEELRAEFERQKAAKEVKKAEELVKSRGEYVAQIDASALFAPAHRIPRPKELHGTPVTLADRWKRVGSNQLMGKHGFEMALTEKIAINFAGQMVSRNGMGGGNLIGTIKTHWNPRLMTELSSTILKPGLVTLKGQYTLSEYTFFTFLFHGTTTATPPAFTLTFGQRLSAGSPITGFTSVRSGSYTLGPWGKDVAALGMEPPSVSVGLTSSKLDGHGWTATTSIGLADTSISMDRGIAPRWLGGAKLRAGISAGLASGFNAFVNGDRNLTENVKLGFGVTGGLPGGVTVRLRFNRLGQKVQIPILLSPISRPDLFIISAAVPLAGLFALETYYLGPQKRKKVGSRLEELRRDNWELIKERRQAAKEGIRVLRPQARRKAAAERVKAGLIILEAYYGREDALPVTTLAGEPEELDRAAWASERREGEADDIDADTEIDASFDLNEFAAHKLYCDVKLPMQALVNRSRLIIPGGRTKANLLGFYDPAMGEKKVLRVRYLFGGQLHEVVFKDKEAVAAPMRAHQL